VRRAAAALLLLAACGADEGPPIGDLLCRVTLARPSARPGEGVDLVVERAWPAGHAAEPFSPKALLPLAVEPLEETRREQRGGVHETLRGRARAFALEDVRVPGPVLRVRAPDGTERSARAADVVLRVEPEVDPAAPGPPELGQPVPEGKARLPVVPALLAVLAALLALAAARLRRRVPTSPSAPAAAWTSPDLGEDAEGFAEALRRAVDERLGVPAPRRTSEETLAGVARLPAGARAALGRVLASADRAKYGARRVPATERGERLADARAVLDALREAAP
jgi:hypothetical protein